MHGKIFSEEEIHNLNCSIFRNKTKRASAQFYGTVIIRFTDWLKRTNLSSVGHVQHLPSRAMGALLKAHYDVHRIKVILVTRL